MRNYEVPVLPITLARNTDRKLTDRDVPGIELEYPWPKYEPRTLFTVAFMAAGSDGLGISFCAEVPHDRITAQHTEPKSRVFEDDCMELFIRTGNDTYYGFEFNPKGALLDYRACPGETVPADWQLTTEQTEAVVHATIAEKPIAFDYSYQTGAVITTEIEDEFWYTELFIPWSALHRTEPPAEGETWTGTINRIDITGTARRAGSKKSAPHAGYQSLISGTDWAQFHQPDYFARFTFKPF